MPRVQTSPSSRLQSGVEFVLVCPTLQLGRIAGIRIGVNWSWLVVFALIVWSLAVSASSRSASYAQNIAAFMQPTSQEYA